MSALRLILIALIIILSLFLIFVFLTGQTEIYDFYYLSLIQEAIEDFFDPFVSFEEEFPGYSLNLGQPQLGKLYGDDFVDIDLKAVELADRGYFLYLDMSIHNKTDQLLSPWLRYIFINGQQVWAYMDEDIDAGEVSEEGIHINLSELASRDIKALQEIEIELNFIYPGEDFENFLETGPLMIDISGNESYLQEVKVEGELFFDAEGVELYYNPVVDEDEDSYWIDLTLVNRSSRDLVLDISYIKHRGQELDPYFMVALGAGKTVSDGLLFFKDEMKSVRKIRSLDLEFVFKEDFEDPGFLLSGPLKLRFE